MARQNRRDRSKAIEADINNRGKYGSSRKWYTIGDDELKELGVSRYVADSGDHGNTKDHFLHILPPHPDDGDPIALKLFVHFGIGIDENAFLCPRLMKETFEKFGIDVPPEIEEGRCPICEHNKVLRASLKRKQESNPSNDYETETAEIKSLTPFPPRYLVWVVDAKDEEKEDEGLKFIVMPSTVYDGMIGTLKNKRTGAVLDITDPIDGKVFVFSRGGKTMTSTRYTEFAIEDRDPIPEKWLDDVLHYVDVLNFATYDEIAAEFLGRDKEERKSVREEAEETKEEIEEKIEEDMGEKPRRRSRRKESDDEDSEKDDNDDRVKKLRERVRRTRKESEGL